MRIAVSRSSARWQWKWTVRVPSSTSTSGSRATSRSGFVPASIFALYSFAFWNVSRCSAAIFMRVNGATPFPFP